MAKIIAPNPEYNGESASVNFENGVGHTDDPNLITWFKENGYKVESKKVKAEKVDPSKADKSKKADPPKTVEPPPNGDDAVTTAEAETENE